MSDEHYRRLERMYHSAPINRFYQPSLTVSEGMAEVSLQVKPEFHHAAEAIHGSVYFKCLDDASFFAVNSVVTDVFVLTVSFNIVLLRPVSDGTITAIGRLVHASRNLLVAEAELLDDQGRIVARGSGTFMKSKSPLTGVAGYQ